MLRVLIVEDEKIVRKGIISLFPWDKFNMKIIGEAENYVKAMAFLQENPTDLIFADLSMPGKSGMELIHDVRSQYPDCFLVALTCHQEFMFIQNALRLGVIDYIVKTQLDIENTDEILARITLRIKERTGRTAADPVEKTEWPSNKYSEEINAGIKRVLSYIDKNISRHIAQEEAAKLASMSKSYFSRCFKDIMGKPFVDYVNETKIKKARNMLLEGNKPVYVIADQLGYNDEKYFSKLFKEYEGLLPSEYRKLERKER